MLIRNPSVDASGNPVSNTPQGKPRGSYAREGASGSRDNTAVARTGDGYAASQNAPPSLTHFVSSLGLSSQGEQAPVVLAAEFLCTHAEGLKTIIERAENYFSSETRQIWREVETAFNRTGRNPLIGGRGQERLGVVSPDPAFDGAAQYADVSDAHWITLDPSRVELFAGDGLNPGEVFQYAFGDCYLLSMLSSMAASDPASVTNMITKKDNGNYEVRFYDMERRSNGSYIPFSPPREILIEVSPSVLVSGDYAVGAQATDADGDGLVEIGVNLIEKAFALYLDQMKASGKDLMDTNPSSGTPTSGYNAYIGGYPDYAYMAMTGKSAYFLAFDKAHPDGSTGSSSQDDLFAALSLANSGGVVVAGTSSNVSTPGLVGAHAYTVLGTVMIDGVSYVALRNPWGMGDCTVDSSHLDTNNDGIFLISFETFKHSFSQVSFDAASLRDAANNGMELPEYGTFVGALTAYESLCTRYLGTPPSDDSDVPNPAISDTVRDIASNGGMSFEQFMRDMTTRSGNMPNVQGLIEYVMREAYLETNRDLYFYAQKVKFFNDVKKQYRDEISRITGLRSKLAPHVDPATGKVRTSGGLPSQVTDVASVQTGLSTIRVYDSVPGADGKPRALSQDEISDDSLKTIQYVTLTTTPNVLDKMESTIKALEAKLSSVGDDAQLANVDLQNMVQKQTQLVQLISNLSKAWYEIARGVIAKIGS